MSKTLEEHSPELKARMMQKHGAWSWPGAMWIVMPNDGVWRPRAEVRDACLALKAKHDGGYVEMSSGTLMRLKERFSEAVKNLKSDGWLESRGMHTAVEFRWRDEQAPWTYVASEDDLIAALGIAENFLAGEHSGETSDCAGCEALRAARRALGMPQGGRP